MSKQSKIAILTSTYERPELLMRNLTALAKQSYENWEHYLVNDGSISDYSSIEKFINDSPRTKYFKLEQNQGLNHALNFGLEKIVQSDCEYLVIVDDDDWLDEEALLMLSKTINEHPNADWLVFNCGNTSNLFNENMKNITEIESVQYPVEYQKKASGDKAHAVIVKCLRGHRNIRFSHYIKNGHENLFWYKLSRVSKSLLINETLVVKEYQLDGLSVLPLYEYDYWKKIRIHFLYLLDNPLEKYYYRLFFKSVFNFKAFRRKLKKKLGTRYDKVKRYISFK